VTIDTRFENQAPTVSVTSETVSEEGLAQGIIDSVGDPTDTTNAASKSGTITITDADSDNFAISLSGPAGVTSGGEDVSWSWNVGDKTLTGTAAGVEVATITLGAQTDNGAVHDVAYTMALKAPIDHPNNSVEDVKALGFVINVTDNSGKSTASSFTVKVEDDMPDVSDSSNEVDMPIINTNLMITLDLSGSMKSSSGVDGLSRLELAQKSLENLINKYDELGDVKVRIVTFGTTAAKQGDVWVSASAAISYLKGLSSSDADGWTNYDAALDVAQDAFDDTGSIAGGQNVSYFLSDGVPTASDGDTDVLNNSSSNAGGSQPDHGIQTAEEGLWKAFLDSNDINSLTLGMGAGSSQVELDPIAYNGSDFNHGDKNAVIVSNLNQLDDVLESTLVFSPVSGSLFVAGDGFGADGGAVTEVTILVTIDGEASPVTVTYSFDGNEITNNYSGSGSLPTITGSLLNVKTASGSLIELEMSTGQYEYQLTAIAANDYSETIDYTLTDKDGDFASATVTLNVEGPTATPPPPPAPDPIVGESIGTNVLIMLDVSGSMDDAFNGTTRLEAAKQSLEDMLVKYNDLGDVKVQLATFSEGKTLLSTEWMAISTAIDKLKEIKNPDGGTNYDYALDGMTEAFNTDGKIANGKNVSYFLSDGKPTLSSDNPDSSSNSGSDTNENLGDGIDSSEQATWEAFVNANNIKSHAVAIGDGVEAKYLEPIAYDGEAGANLAAIVPPSQNALTDYLENSVVAPGHIFTGTGADDLIVGGLGEDFMTGNAGADSFIFDASTMGSNAVETDTITDFNQGQGDKLDLTDLLSSENANSLEDYLSFTKDGNDTLINVKSDGSGNVDHVIKLENTDLTNNGNNSDQQIIDDLLSGNNLLTD
jgi:Mg-chelatase subunit ChlD